MNVLKLLGANLGTTPASYSYNAITGDGNNLSTYTFTGVSIGSAATGRLVVAVISFTSISGTLSTVTIGGVSATIHTTALGSNSARMAIASAVIDTGTTATFVATFSAAPLRCTLASYSVYDLSSTTPIDTLAVGVGTSGSTISGDIDAQNGGVLIGGSYISSSTVTTSWTNLVEDAERVEEAARTTSVASDTASSTTTRTITATFSSSLADNKALVVCSWR